MNPNRKDTGTITVHVNIDRDDVDRFERLYPRCRTRFLRRCMQIALNDKIFFDKIFFPELLLEHGLSTSNV